ncbi:hypothetical protein HF086_017275 [Spodoptera exigua]|uniref:Peptidase M12A domain-containing protein n=1 Tax=Spodoptera exigua TaxID=7107 RepID=A0A922LZW5_SPOEX|nr:hypothetical protein HF086_017275 [Spodoptera exigua]
MFRLLCVIFLYFAYVDSELWKKGVVHYAINKKDYDVIASTFEQLEREICVKFFNTPLNYNATDKEKILYIANPDKRKDCPPKQYNYKKNIIKEKSNIGTLLSATDRNFINLHYLEECGNLVQKPVESRRSNTGILDMSAANEKFYGEKLWPLGIVMYGIDPQIFRLPEFGMLTNAMSIIERSSCIIFQSISEKEPLQPKHLLWFGLQGEETPNLGFTPGNETISLMPMIHGTPGHTTHTLNALMRALGIPMMSNRYDRDYYVRINWKKVAMMSEHYLERESKDAWLQNSDGEGVPYDYDSVTHAPANFMCADCSLGEQTVIPIQDHLWQRTLSMGHRSDLSPGDRQMLAAIYNKECQRRFASNLNK